jgi:hypothetical protein
MARDTTYAQEALSANDSTFSIEALEAAQQNSFDRILSQLSSQAAIQQNLETPTDTSTSPDGSTTLYVSPAGYSTLFATQPKTLYLSEGKGARTRPTNAIVDQVVLHSFGWSIDSVALRAGAKSIQVDSREVGYNPYKVYQRVQQVLFGARQATSHIITRRGDILSACPWNRAPAVNAGGQAASLRVPERSISIELEAWWTGYNVDFRRTPEGDFKILGQMPYTPEQITALAFLLRKLGIWSSCTPTDPLGFTYAQVSSVVGNASGHRPGIVNVSALDRGRAGSMPYSSFRILPSSFTSSTVSPTSCSATFFRSAAIICAASLSRQPYGLSRRAGEMKYISIGLLFSLLRDWKRSIPFFIVLNLLICCLCGYCIKHPVKVA